MNRSIEYIFVIFCPLSVSQKKAFHHSDTNDSALGHMLVLMQYDWPKEENLFFDVMKRIKKEGEFSYPLFFHYIVCILFVLLFKFIFFIFVFFS